MPGKGQKKERPFVGRPDDPLALSIVADAMIERLRVRNYSPNTLKSHRINLDSFLEWCHLRAIGSAAEVTPAILENFQRWLYHFRKPDGQPLGFTTQHGRLQTVRFLFQWLARSRLLPYNPASEIELPRVHKRLPKHVLTAEEADRIISQPDLDSPLGLRDRAILEVLYSSGMRRSELVALRLYDVDLDHGTLRIRKGKGGRDRVLPLGERACHWTQKYLLEVRPFFVVEPDEGVLFINHYGEQMHPNFLGRRVREYIDQANIGKAGSCHLFRHAMATLMLENGADIRYIQQMLGHANLETTEIYTHVSIRKLKDIHTATHPSARMKKRESGAIEWRDAAEDASSETTPVSEPIEISAPVSPDNEPEPLARNPVLPSGKTINHRSPVLNRMRKAGQWAVPYKKEIRQQKSGSQSGSSRGGERWDEEEDQRLIRTYDEGTSLDEIAARHGRSRLSVWRRVRHLAKTGRIEKRY
jgi:integrase/recombinase XerD